MNARVEQFIANLVETFGHTQADLNEMWEQTDTDTVVVEETVIEEEKKSVDSSKCTVTLTRGKGAGKQCDKAAKKGGDLCTVHSKKSGEKKDKKSVEKKSGDKKLTVKKWEEILFSQIPEHLVHVYRNETRFLIHVKLTRTTANNVAAWINGGELCEELFRAKYSELPGGKADCIRRMRDSLVMAHIHPTDNTAQFHVDRLCNTSKC